MKIKTLRIILEYLLVVCIILEFNTVYGALPIFKRMVQILPAAILLGLIMMTPQKLSKKMGFCVILYFMGAIFPMLNIKSDAYISYIKTYVVILPLLWIYLSQRKQVDESAYFSLFLKYSNVMTMLAAISVVMWALCSVLQVIPMTGLFPYAWGEENISFIPSYYNIYFETQTINLFGSPFMRNSGIFCEGPMYNMTLCVALTIEYFMRPIRSRRKIIILTIAILSTLTTTGQLFLLALLAWHVLRKITGRYRLLILVMAPLVIIGVYVLTNTIMDFKSDSGGDGSVDSRMWDIMNCIDAGIKNPLFGVGIAQREDVVIWRGSQLGYSNSLFAIFARGGIYVLALYLISLLIIPVLHYRKFKQGNWMMAMICYLGLFTITVCYMQYLTLLFMALGVSNIDLAKWKKNPSSQMLLDRHVYVNKY